MNRIEVKNNLVTTFGKFADPLADKILVISALCCFIELKLMSSIIVILVLFREFAVTSVRLVAVENGKVIAANIWGKAKTVSQMVAIGVVFLTQYILELATNGLIPLEVTSSLSSGIYIVNNIFLWISAVLAVISGVVYIKDNFEFIKNAK